MRAYSWSQLRNLLAEVGGGFWERDAERVWLRSAAKAAAALGVERLRGRPVGVPLEALLGGIGTVRAHLYASFHSGRKESNPISRATLEELTGVPARTQRAYEEIAGVESERNVAVGEPYTEEAMREQAWERGKAVFHFVDGRGRRGRAGRAYVAWHLPNAYEGPHQQLCKGRQKKINRELADLVMKGMRGNDRETVDRLFWPHSGAAGKAYNRKPGVDAYWTAEEVRAGSRAVWDVLPAERGC